jgi:hypothetical protein
MASPFVTTPLIGADLNGVTTAAQLAAGQAGDARLGTIMYGTNGRYYVYGQANAAIPASTTACTVNATTFLATASGGSYTSPATALASGDRCWFSKASV